MPNRLRTFGAIVATSASLSLAACGHKQNTATAGGEVVAPPASTVPATTTPDAATPATTAEAAPAHHSKLKGALLGAAAGHVLGGHAVAGAAAGALIQHERNKKP